MSTIINIFILLIVPVLFLKITLLLVNKKYNEFVAFVISLMIQWDIIIRTMDRNGMPVFCDQFHKNSMPELCDQIDSDHMPVLCDHVESDTIPVLCDPVDMARIPALANVLFDAVHTSEY